MQNAQKIHITEQDFLEMERCSPYKHEYYRGEVFAMGGASFNHNIISSNIQSVVLPYLKNKKCNLYSNDLRIYVPNPPFFSYPDLVIICDEPEFVDEEFDTIKNPKIIIEILSPSTANYDREVKFGLYGFAPSFEEYILIHQDKPKVECFLKILGLWQHWELEGIDQKLNINKIALDIPLKEIYEGVEFKTKEIKIVAK